MFEKSYKTIIHSLFFLDYFLISIFLSLFVFSISLSYASILATTFAIIFSISVLAIQHISQNYSFRVLDYYRNDNVTIFTLGIIVSGIFVIIIYNITNSNLPFLNFLSILLFFSSFHILLIYFDKTMKIINPVQLSELLLDEGKGSIAKCSSKESRDIISLIGDISTKSLIKKETSSTKQFIGILFEFDKACIEVYKRNPRCELFHSNVGEIGNYIYVENIFEAIADENLRILKQSLDQKEIVINREIYKNASKLIANTINEPNEIFSEYLKLNSLIFEMSLTAKDPARFLYLNRLIGIYQNMGYQPIKIENINDLISSFYLRINQNIVQENDFDLFKNEINSLCLGLMDSPNHIIEELANNLYFIQETRSNPSILYYDRDFSENLSRRRSHLQNFIRNEIPENYNKIFEYQKLVIEFIIFVIQHLESEKNKNISENQPQIVLAIDETIERLKSNYLTPEGNFVHDSLQLYGNAQLYRTFFLVGTNILYTQKTKEIIAEKYIKELWEHTQPEDADAFSLNTTPVSFNARWLTSLLFFGGAFSETWKDDFSLKFEDFHGVTDYVYQYYLLCIAESILKNEGSLNLIPSSNLPQVKSESPETLFREYSFVTQFMLEKERFEKYHKILSQQSKKYNLLFKGDAKNSFIGLKDWIDKSMDACDKQEKEIISVLDLDSTKVEKAREEILKSYKNTSQLDKIFNTKKYVEDEDSALTFGKIGQRLLTPKHCLITPSNVMCDLIWSSYGESISEGERKYIYDTLNDSTDLEKIDVDFSSIEVLLQVFSSTINTLKSEGFNPQTIFIPLDIKSELFRLLHQKPEKSELWNAIQRYNIIHSWKNHPFDNIVIIDKNTCLWTYKTNLQADERLAVEIAEYPEDRQKVDFTLFTVFNLRVLNPNGIKIIKISNFHRE
jgi:hypothetical protein